MPNIKHLNKFKPIDIACESVGGITVLARLLNVKTPTVHQWLLKSRPVPPVRCCEIERLTEGIITRKMLRPDDWQKIWPELDKEG